MMTFICSRHFLLAPVIIHQELNQLVELSLLCWEGLDVTTALPGGTLRRKSHKRCNRSQKRGKCRGLSPPNCPDCRTGKIDDISLWRMTQQGMRDNCDTLCRYRDVVER